MRRAVLWKSVLRLTKRSETLEQVAFVWARHRLMVPFALAALAALTGVAWALDFPTWSARLAIGAAGAAIAVNATTEYRVLGLSDRRILVCRASRIRQKASELHSDLPLDATFERAPGGTLVTSTWRVGEAIYTVPRSSQIAIEDMRARLAGG